MRTRAFAVAAALLVTQPACFTLSTTDVQLRDAKAVDVRSAKTDAEVLPPQATEGVLERGTYWHTLAREPYEVHVSRDPATGELALRCDACADPGMLLSGTGEMKLLDETGRTLPTTSWSVDVARDRVTVDYDLCFIHGRRTCSAEATPRLVVPMRDVVEVRRRVEPVRFWGWMLLGFGAIAAAMTSYLAFAPGSPAGATLGERAPWVAGFFVPTATFTGVGLWEVLSPAREQIWTPPP